MTEARATGGASPSESFLRAACLGATVLAVLPGLQALAFIWDSSEYLGYGYLVPASSAALCVLRRAELRAAFAEGPPPRLGFAAVLAAALVESLGVLGEVATLAGLGVPLLLAASAYALGGPRLVRAAALPIGFLVFMVPPPGFLEERALLALKALVIHASVALLQTAGFSIAAEGNRLFVPGHELFVANACSGLRSVVTLLPLAVVVAAFLARGVWRRVVLVASVVPLAVVGNVLRVVATVVLVARFGAGYAEGALHESFGFATFLLGAGALIGVAKALR